MTGGIEDIKRIIECAISFRKEIVYARFLQSGDITLVDVNGCERMNGGKACKDCCERVRIDILNSINNKKNEEQL